MPRYVSKSDPDVTIDVGNDDPLPGGLDAWNPEGSAGARRKRRTDTGTVPVQRGDGH